MSYLDIVEDVLLGLIRASREGNWLLHLHAIRQMISCALLMTRSIMQGIYQYPTQR